MVLNRAHSCGDCLKLVMTPFAGDVGLAVGHSHKQHASGVTSRAARDYYPRAVRRWAQAEGQLYRSDAFRHDVRVPFPTLLGVRCAASLAATEKLSPPAACSFTATCATGAGRPAGSSLRLCVPDRDPETAEEVIGVVPAGWTSVRSRRSTGGALLVLTDA